MQLDDLRRWSIRTRHRIERPLYNVFVMLPKALREKRKLKFGRGPYGHCMWFSDSFLGIRFRLKGKRYAIVGLHVDDTWYDPTISYGIVLLGKWYGFFVDYK